MWRPACLLKVLAELGVGDGGGDARDKDAGGASRPHLALGQSKLGLALAPVDAVLRIHRLERVGCEEGWGWGSGVARCKHVWCCRHARRFGTGPAADVPAVVRRPATRQPTRHSTLHRALPCSIAQRAAAAAAGGGGCGKASRHQPAPPRAAPARTAPCSTCSSLVLRNVTKPKPRDFPVYFSRIICASSTTPN